MRTHTIPRKPEVLDWSQIPALPIDNLCWTPAIAITAQAQICYDEEALYVRLSAREAVIRAEHTGPIGMPCEDSCLEFFFSPIPGDDRYLNFEYNPNACLYLGMGSGIHDLVRLLPDSKNPFRPQPRRIDGGWEIVYQVPTEFVRRFFPDYAPVSGGTIRANFYKCGDLTPQEHYLSWNPMTCDTPAFHRPCDFGLLTFA